MNNLLMLLAWRWAIFPVKRPETTARDFSNEFVNTNDYIEK